MKEPRGPTSLLRARRREGFLRRAGWPGVGLTRSSAVAMARLPAGYETRSQVPSSPSTRSMVPALATATEYEKELLPARS